MMMMRAARRAAARYTLEVEEEEDKKYVARVRRRQYAPHRFYSPPKRKCSCAAARFTLLGTSGFFVVEIFTLERAHPTEFKKQQSKKY